MANRFINVETGEGKTYREWQRSMAPKLLRAALLSATIVPEGHPKAAAAAPAPEPEPDPRAGRKAKQAAAVKASKARKREAQASGRPVTALQERALRTLEAGPGTASAVAAASGMDVYVASGTLTTLVERGLAHSTRVKRKSVYDLTSDGLKVLGALS